MKKLPLAVLLTTAMAGSVAFAANHTASVGYAQSKVQDFDDIRGVNLQYRYESGAPLSLLTSFTYMKGKGKQHYMLSGDTVNNHINIKYYSLQAGPAYSHCTRHAPQPVQALKSTTGSPLSPIEQAWVGQLSTHRRQPFTGLTQAALKKGLNPVSTGCCGCNAPVEHA
jgi:hypothetical protein